MKRATLVSKIVTAGLVVAGIVALQASMVGATKPPAKTARGTWSQLSPSTSPGARFFASMAYDRSANDLLLFGGQNPVGLLSDTWTWNGSTWNQLFPATAPPGPNDASMVYDQATHEVVLFGGSDSVSDFNQTWVFDGANWTELSPANSPPARAQASMVYDQATNEVVLFGGNNSSGDLNDTWVWDGTTWTQVSDSGDPGCLTACTSGPSGRAHASMTYDAATGNVVLFGGTSLVSDFNDTWTWNGSSWTQLSPSSSPLPRHGASIAYDSTSRSVVLFGGNSSGTDLNDTWKWNGSTWTQVSDSTDPGCTTTCTASPSSRSSASMAYDQATAVVTLFGGNSSGSADSDTWAFRG